MRSALFVLLLSQNISIHWLSKLSGNTLAHLSLLSTFPPKLFPCEVANHHTPRTKQGHSFWWTQIVHYPVGENAVCTLARLPW